MNNFEVSSPAGCSDRRKILQGLIMLLLAGLLFFPVTVPALAQTATASPTRTDTSTPTETNTITPSPTRTATSTRTETPTATSTFTPTITLTPTITNTRIPSQTPTPTLTLTLEKSLTPTPTATLPLKIADPCLKVYVVNTAAASLGWNEQMSADCTLPVAEVYHTTAMNTCALDAGKDHQDNQIVIVQEIQPDKAYPPITPLPGSTLETVPFHGTDAYLYTYSTADTAGQGAALFWRFGNIGMQAWHQIDCYSDGDAIDVFQVAEALYQATVVHGIAIQSGLCNGISCQPYCEGNTYYFYGSCDDSNGQCIYTSETCEYGCDAAADQCAGPPPTATPISSDLSIREIRLLQAINGGHPVAWKPAVVKASFDWPDPNMAITVNATLLVDETTLESRQMTVKSEYSADEIAAGDNYLLYHIPAGLLSPGPHTIILQADILPSSERPDLVDTNLSNNVALLEDRYFQDGHDLTLMMQPIDGLDSRTLWLYLVKAYPYLLDVLPVINIDAMPIFRMDREGSAENGVSHLVDLSIKRLLYNAFLADGERQADFSVGLHPDDFYGDEQYATSYGWMHDVALAGAGNTRLHAHEALARVIGQDLLMKDQGLVEPAQYNFTLPQDALIFKGQEGVFEDLNRSGASYLNFMSNHAGGNMRSWVDADTWNNLADIFTRQSTARYVPSHLSSPQSFHDGDSFHGVLLAGQISADGNVDVDTFLWLDKLTSTVPEVQSDYRLQTLGFQGEVLAEYPVYIDESLADPAPFLLTFPADENSLAGVQLVYGDQALWQQMPSGNAPLIQSLTLGEVDSGVVEVTPTIEGEEVQASALQVFSGADVSVSWMADDADGDALKYTLLYSADEGKRWLPLAADLSLPFYTLQTGELPGCTDCRLKLLASDGWYTAEWDATDPFSIEDKHPGVAIISPRKNLEFDEGQPIIFLAMAYDEEDGILKGDNITWYSSRDDLFGSGERLETSSLSPGKHIIRALATDHAGNQAEISINLTILAKAKEGDGGIFSSDNWGYAALCCLCGSGIFILVLSILYVRLVMNKPKSEKNDASSSTAVVPLPK